MSSPSLQVGNTSIISKPAPAVGSRFIGKRNWGAAGLLPLWLMTHRHVKVSVISIALIIIVEPVLAVIVGFATNATAGTPVSVVALGFINAYFSLLGIGFYIYFTVNGNKIAVKSGRFATLAETDFVAG